MKRKLDDNDGLSPVVGPPTKETRSQTFENLGLDVRLLQALGQEKFTIPTPVQSQAIPLALEGKDILGTSMACVRYMGPLANSNSAGQNWFGQNRSLRPSYP